MDEPTPEEVDQAYADYKSKWQECNKARENYERLINLRHEANMQRLRDKLKQLKTRI